MKKNLPYRQGLWQFVQSLFRHVHFKLLPAVSCVAAILFLLVGSAHAQVTFSTTTLPSGMDYTGSFSAAVVVADFNNDGRPDIIYNNGSGTGITYLQNNSDGSFSTPATNPFSNFTASSPTGTTFNVACAVADYDGDGDLDIWVRVNGGSAIAPNDVYLVNDNGTYIKSDPIAGMEYTGTQFANAKVADINGDGFPDIIYNNGAGTAVTYLQNNNGNSFSTPSPNPFATILTSVPSALVFNLNTDIADFDGDGDLDIWVRVSGGTALSPNDVYLLNNNGTYENSTVLPGLEFTSSATSSVKVGDLDGDGLADIVYNTAASQPLIFLRNFGGSFATPTPNPLAAYASGAPTGVYVANFSSVADFDGDGDLDLWIRLPNTNDDFYTTASGAAPGLASATPAHQASNVPVNSNITLEFNENVFTKTGGFFQIRLLSDSSVVETIPADAPNVTGSGTTTITIDPATDLAHGTSYFLTFNRLALADVDGVIAGRLNQELRIRVPETTPDFLTFSTAGTLPVTLTDFIAIPQGDGVSLSWETSFEWNARDFAVQHSTDAATWNTIATVTAAGYSNTSQQYSFLHRSPAPGINYYRLLQTDLDGATQLSRIRSVKHNSKKYFKLFPNPATKAIRIETDLPGTKHVRMYNAAGVLVHKGMYQSTILQLPVSQLPNGIYHVLVDNGNDSVEQILIKQ
ncbi:MAG: FG-GAP-like repeat-containing protein [Pseudobacter sp.]|uniref:FG-GAP-like repeat-containing protein n=1 Tax=Pseudobacter sp. TaxID=2045420 RepID=UPI003F81B3D7